MSRDVELRRVESSHLFPDAFADLRVDGDPCYGEECCGCCGTASTYLSRPELEALRDKITELLNG